MNNLNNQVNILEKVIQKIKVNRISTTEIADCLNKTGSIPNIIPLNRGHFSVGPVFLTIAEQHSNWPVHERFSEIPAGAIVVVETIDCENRGPIGALMAKFAMLYRQAAGIVVNAPVRDAPHLIKENWPIWSTGVTPIGCFNRKPEGTLDVERKAELQKIYEGSIAVCDDSGVVIVPAERIDEEFIRLLDWIEEQEDVWNDCVNRRKWTTFDTICLKRYRENDA